VILSVLAGWLFFKERNIGERLFAIAIMGAGILLIYQPDAHVHEGWIAVLGLVAFLLRTSWKRYQSLRSQEDGS
jgi:drug/metabolite transporter (DMT)-like permease